MSTPRISVIIPAYNHARSLPGCLDSLRTQTLPPAEIIVVDDGSTDDTQAVLANYQNLTVLTQANSGAPAARNHGFAQSTGDYVIFADADLLFEPTALATLFTALQEHSEASYAYGGFTFGRVTFKGLPFDSHRLHDINYIHTSSLIRRSAFPGFDPAVKRLQDWDLWLTMEEQGHIGVCASVAPLYRVRIDGPSRIGSYWVPKIFYKLPWSYLGWTPAPVQKYFNARAILQNKHPALTQRQNQLSSHNVT
jgi:glycosyltransferase involved in cell wall biosynthesis